MTFPQPNRTGPLGTFYKLFEDHLSTDDYTQFLSNRRKKGLDTYLHSDFYKADKMADVILEEYGVRNKLTGNVIVAIPEPAWDVPIFFFQLGGNDRQKIAMLDISPTSPSTDYTPLIPLWEKYSDLLNLKPPTLDWVKSISSPYLLEVDYAELDTELFLEAMYEYLCVWIEHYYKPASRQPDAAAEKYATEAIFRFKTVLHSNDPAYNIFLKAWGKPVADAFFYLETRSHPSLPMPDAH
jgi:hypothetical protein